LLDLNHSWLIALSVEHLPVRKDAPCGDVEREARKYMLAEPIWSASMSDDLAGCGSSGPHGAEQTMRCVRRRRGQ
jgi:hypothetical protein